MLFRSLLLSFALLFAAPASIFAQDASQPASSEPGTLVPLPPPNTVNPPLAQPADSMTTPITVDAAVQSLMGQFSVMVHTFQSKRGYDPADRDAIVSLRGRIAEVLRGNPEEIRLLAMNLTLSDWLNDRAQVDSLYQRIVALKPDNTDIPKAWARSLRSSGDYAKAADVLSKLHIDPLKEPDLQLELAKAYFNSEQFDLALAALSQISVDSLDKRQFSFIATTIEDLKPQWLNYLEYWSAEQSIRAAEEAADDLPTADLVTDKGIITIELFENQAPNTVANFISLAESSFYDNTTFHYQVPGDRIAGGDPNSKPGAIGKVNEGHAGYYIPTEFARPDARKNFTGSLGMWTMPTVPNPSSMFYISYAPLPASNDRFTVFARVTHGMDVLFKLQQDDVLKTVTITRKRDHAYTPEKIPLPTGVAAGQATPLPPPSATLPPNTQPAASVPATP